MATPGVYRIQIGPWFYYGSSVDIPVRLRQHLIDLKGGRHGNKILQRAFREYGEFDAYAVDLCLRESVRIREQYFLDATFDDQFSANLARDAESPGKYREVSAESRRKMRKAALGRTHSAETRKKMSKSRKGVKKTPESVAKTAAGRRGKKVGPEGRERMRLSRLQYAQENPRPIRVEFEDGTTRDFVDGNAVGEFAGVHRANVYMWLGSKRPPPKRLRINKIYRIN